MRRAILLFGVAGMVACSPRTYENLSLERTLSSPPVVPDRPVIELKGKAFVLREDLRKDVPAGKERVEVKRGECLETVLKRLEIGAVAEETVSCRKAPLSVVFEGERRDVLDRIASLFGVYWTFDGAVVRFVPEKTLIYTIPLVARERLEVSYADGELPVEKIREDLFEEIEKKLSEVLSWNYELTVERKVSEREERKESELRAGERTGGVSSSETLARNDSKTRTGSLIEERSEEGKRKEGEKAREGAARGKGKNRNSGEIDLLFEDSREKERLREGKERKHSATTTTFSDGRKRDLLRVSRTERKNLYQDKDEKGKEERKEGSLLVKETRKAGRKVVVLRSAGVVMVRVSRQEETLVRRLMESLLENRLSSMAFVEVYALETSWEDVKEFVLSFSGGARSGKNSFSLSGGSGSGGLKVEVIRSSYELRLLLDFLLRKKGARVLSRPSLLVLSGMPARIKSAVEIPYLEPRLSSLQTGTAQLTYTIQKVSDGVEMTLVPYVVGEDVILSVGVSVNQYLGDKTLQAGTLGTVDLPVSAPRGLFTTLRLKAGQGVLIGGVKVLSAESARELSVLSGAGSWDSLQGRDLVLVIIPRIVRFGDGG